MEEYLRYRRVVLQDSTDVFEERRKARKKGEVISDYTSTCTCVCFGLNIRILD